YTAYFQQMEKSRLEVSFELEADRMRNLRLDPAEFAKEVQVVMEERRMRTEDDPQSLTYEQFAATAFLTSPYHHPVIGWMDDLKNMTVSDLARWYQHFYAPNNAVLVVVGDVDPDHVLALARKHFGALKPSPLPVLKPRGEIPQQGERRIIVRAPAELPYLVMGYKVPVLKSAAEDWEPYALEVLAGVLDGGASARFASRLVRGSEVAASVGAGYSMTDRLPGLFLINGTPAREHTIEELRSAIKEQVGLLKSERVSEAELKRVKAQVMASEVYQNDSTFYQAMEIGMLESVGLGWRTGEDYLERVNAVTAEQVRAVARKYLVDDRLTVAILDPLPMDRAAALRRSHGGQHVVR
ncbi:MAG TPA: insulinase family protein, partial [Gammaproteobacteria bacterium]|nr:insulinase family protein [Gammaproteobacteria bacterium]